MEAELAPLARALSITFRWAYVNGAADPFEKDLQALAQPAQQHTYCSS
jgi:hypothetical protein